MAQLDRAHVAVIVGNDVTADSRVRKCVATLVDAGLRVTVLDHDPRGGAPPSLPGAEVLRPKVTSTELTSGLVSPQRLRELATTVTRAGRYASDEQRRRAVLQRKVAERRTGAAMSRLKLDLRDAGDGRGRVAAGLRRRLLAWVIRLLRVWLRVRRQVHDYRDGRNVRGVEEFPFASSDTELSPRDVRRDWRSALPDAAAIELAFGPVLDRLAPDVIHAHDHLMVPIAAEAALRGRAAGRDVRWIYDAHEYVRGLTTLTDDRRRALAAAEARFLPSADAVVTVSPALADRLRSDHGLEAPPTVVLNAPPASEPRADVPSLRAVIGLDEDTPLLVYSGNVTPARGVHTLIDAMALIDPSVQLALVVGHRVAYLDRLLERADEAGTRDRIHLAPYVAPEEVTTYLAGADVGVHPMRRYPNGDIALPNKLFEYLHARLPVVVSDCPAQAAMVRELGFGQVFEADDPADLARAVGAVLAAGPELRQAVTSEVIDRYSWESQARELLDVYRSLGVSLPATSDSASSSENPTRA